MWIDYYVAMSVNNCDNMHKTGTSYYLLLGSLRKRTPVLNYKPQ